MGLFGDFRKRRKPDEQGLGFEYYEDTHNEYGEYVGFTNEQNNQRTSNEGQNQTKGQRQSSLQNSSEYDSETTENTGERPFILPDQNQTVTPRNYQNVVVYKPTSPEDVQTLIDFLKRREPAIVNLDDLDGTFSQRILDFISGAIYALSGSVHRVAGNIFLLSPEGVEITVPYEKVAKRDS